MPTSNYLTAIANDYEAAEITCILLHNRKTRTYFNLLTLIELVPCEQPHAPLIGTAQTSFADRANVDGDYTVFIARAINLSVTNGVAIFENAQGGFQLVYGAALDASISLFPESILTLEPAGEYPLLITNRQEETIGVLLPERPTGFRVWCKLDKQKKFISGLSEKRRKKIFEKAGKLTARHLGFDLSALQQHAGHFYLFGCNPYIRFYESSLVDCKQDLLIKFRERKGKSLMGGRIVFKDKRGDNYGFHTETDITDRLQRIQLPNFPDTLHTTLFDRNGFVLETNTGTWANFSFQMNIHAAVVNLNVQEGEQTRTQRIDKYSNADTLTVGSYDHSTAKFLKESVRKNEIERMAALHEFVFFPGSKEDKEKARRIIHSILNKANRRCLLLDPYFGAIDLYHAYTISSISVPVQILSSEAFLEMGDNAVTLQQEIERFTANIPQQKIECRVLKSKRNKSPLHDRYIVVDDAAYLLGSSFNEFGTRATTLFKVPVPETMISKAFEWWQDEKQSMQLDDFVNKKKLTRGSEDSV